MRKVNVITREVLRDQYMKFWQQIELYKTWNGIDVDHISKLTKEIKALKKVPSPGFQPGTNH